MIFWLQRKIELILFLFELFILFNIFKLHPKIFKVDRRIELEKIDIFISINDEERTPNKVKSDDFGSNFELFQLHIVLNNRGRDSLLRRQLGDVEALLGMVHVEASNKVFMFVITAEGDILDFPPIQIAYYNHTLKGWFYHLMLNGFRLSYCPWESHYPYC